MPIILPRVSVAGRIPQSPLLPALPIHSDDEGDDSSTISFTDMETGSDDSEEEPVFRCKTCGALNDPTARIKNWYAVVRGLDVCVAYTS